MVAGFVDCIGAEIRSALSFTYTRLMNDELPINEQKAAAGRRKRRLPAPLEAAGFAVQERVIWPLQDRFDLQGIGPSRNALLGGGAFALFVALLVVLTTSGGGSAPPTTVGETPSSREPLISAAPTAPKPKPKKEAAPHETLHGAAPVFSPPSPASKGGEKTGASKSVAGDSAANGASSSAGSSSDANGSSTASDNSNASGPDSESTDSGSAESASSSPTAARISSDPEKSASGDSKAAADPAAAARAAVPNGPPAGADALKVAREFAKGFVVYETGGEASAFRDAFAASATPQLRKALLQRPPKQPAGVKVPRAKVLNVVAGPSQGRVYKVSVSLLRVGVTSELRLDMEKIKTAGKSGKGAEWRVTNVLG
jgi:hypothetical protein